MKTRDYIHIPYTGHVRVSIPNDIAVMLGFKNLMIIKRQSEFDPLYVGRPVARQTLMQMFDELDIQHIGYHWYNNGNTQNMQLYVNDDETAMKIRLRFEIVNEKFIADEHALAVVNEDRAFLRKCFELHSEKYTYVPSLIF